MKKNARGIILVVVYCKGRNEMVIDLKEQFKEKLEQEFNCKWDECSNLKRFLMYRASRMKIDCDVSEQAVDQYLKKYPWIFNGQKSVQAKEHYKYEIKAEGTEVYRGDTMTSAWNFVRDAIQLADNYQTEVIENEKIKGSLSKNIKELILIIDNLKWDSINGLNKQLNDFVTNCHTAGNFLPVPLYFNSERSGYYANRDCWDITMIAIFGWYADNPELASINLDVVDIKKDKWLIGLFSGTGNGTKVMSVINCKKWLMKFERWSYFVKKNKLEVFVLKKKDKYLPKRIIDNKIYQFSQTTAQDFFNKDWKELKPGKEKKIKNWDSKDKENLVLYLENLNKSITKRSESFVMQKKMSY
ncbi:MAG: hypothetical protein Q8936_19600 [Bacillota bacterium]|nr:hypothetical protein [Bacillota bacterium]